VSAGPAGPRHGWPARLRRLVLLLVLQVVVILALLELFGRIVDPLGISYYPETARYLDTLILEEPIGYRNAPNLEGRFWGAPVAINSAGLRDREIEQNPGENEFRVLVMGDSVPFGFGVSYEDSIPHRLEQLLNAGHDGSLRFRTVNMGVPSYNTEQQLIQLETQGLQLHPDVVLLFFVRNDLQSKMWVLQKRENWFVDKAQRSYAACLLVVLYRHARQALGLRNTRLGEEKYDATNPRWIAVTNALREIHRRCSDSNIPFVLFPVYGPKVPQLLAAVEQIGHSDGFPVINVFPWSAEQKRVYENSVTDSHPNPAGSKLFARALYDGLRRSGVLPEGLAAHPVPVAWDPAVP
jgi:lysophospholipase L1-like esterase